MLIQICKSKIAHARVTQAELQYEGSITIDQSLLDAVGIIAYEKVEVLNVNNGNRFETYAISGKRGSGKICLNGPAARLGQVGDEIIVLSYALAASHEAKEIKTKIVYLSEKNKITKKKGY